MFAIVSGLGHGSVSRLKASWDRLPAKYNKLFEVREMLSFVHKADSYFRYIFNVCIKFL